MNLPVLNHSLNLVIKGTTHHVTCTDVFDAGYGYYFDALFSPIPRQKFSEGEQCTMPELGANCLADFASYPKKDRGTARFLITKWS